MRRQQLQWIWVLSLVCVVFGSDIGTAFGQDDDLEYAGTRECRSCHRSYANDHRETVHGRTLLEVAEVDEDDEPAIIADFETGEEIRTVEFADDETRAFTEDDVIFTLGAGRNYQAYVTEVDDEIYRVLPAQWNVSDETWVPLSLADDWSDPAYDFNSQCAGCHTTNFNAENLEWDEEGVQCEACHGPGLLHVELADDAGSSLSEAEYDEVSSAINFSLDSQVCGQCHIRGLHAESGLPHPVAYYPGNDLLDESTFTPVDPGDETAWFSTTHAKLPNMQFNEWLQSSHTIALDSAQESDNFEASCLSCHSVAQRRVDYLIDEEWVDEDEFDRLSVLDDHAFGITCASCHNPHEVENETFLVDEPYPLCISCHSNGEDTENIHHPVQEMFEGLELIENIVPIAGAHFSAEDGPTCITCHMQSIETKNGIRQSHTFHPVSPAGAVDIDDLQDACTACHTDIEDPIQMQRLIDSVQANVSDRLTRVQATLTDDTPAWLGRALSAIDGDGSQGIHNFAYTHAILSAIENELGLVGETVTDSDVAQLVADSLPPIEVTDTPIREPIVPPVGGLKSPSMLLLGICALIILISAYAFFVRGGQDD